MSTEPKGLLYFDEKGNTARSRLIREIVRSCSFFGNQTITGLIGFGAGHALIIDLPSVDPILQVIQLRVDIGPN